MSRRASRGGGGGAEITTSLDGRIARRIDPAASPAAAAAAAAAIVVVLRRHLDEDAVISARLGPAWPGPAARRRVRVMSGLAVASLYYSRMQETNIAARPMLAAATAPAGAAQHTSTRK